MLEIKESFLTKNPCYISGRKHSGKGLMLHSVGCAQPNASVFVNSWNQSVGACVHAFIDSNTGVVQQTLPWWMRGWHGASGSKGSCNDTHIGVEMCQSHLLKYINGYAFIVSNSDDLARAREQAKIAYDSAVLLFAKLCKDYGWNPLADGVIISHKEGYKRGIASNHGDPESYWNGLGMEYTMDGFRKDVAKAMNVKPVADILPETKEQWYRVRKTWEDDKSQVAACHDLNNAKIYADKNKGYSVFDESGKNIYNPHTVSAQANATTQNENAVNVSTVTENTVYKAQRALNEYFKSNIANTGMINNETKVAIRKAMQTALNLDLKAGLAVDGIIGEKTKAAIKKVCIGYRDVGYVVTVIEIALMAYGYETYGIEYAGQCGSGLCNAITKFQKNNCLTADGLAGYNTIMKILE